MGKWKFPNYISGCLNFLPVEEGTAVGMKGDIEWCLYAMVLIQQWTGTLLWAGCFLVREVYHWWLREQKARMFPGTWYQRARAASWGRGIVQGFPGSPYPMPRQPCNRSFCSMTCPFMSLNTVCRQAKGCNTAKHLYSLINSFKDLEINSIISGMNKSRKRHWWVELCSRSHWLCTEACDVSVSPPWLAPFVRRFLGSSCR